MDLKEMIKDTVKEMIEDGDIEIKIDDAGQLYLEIANQFDEDDFDDENSQEVEEEEADDEEED